VRRYGSAMNKRVFAFAALLFGLAGGAADAADRPLTVVELFTSEGCNSCPPADAYLGILGKRPDLLALSFHVDYWDYLGWKDTFAFHEATERQRAYSASLGSRYVYTPQLVIGGRSHAVGSDQGAVDDAIAEVAAHAHPVDLSVQKSADGKMLVGLPSAPAKGKAVVWLMRFDGKHDVKIGGGENGGKTLTYYNVVRDVRQIGSWNGAAEQIAIDPASLRGTEHCAVLLQENGSGAILGAARLPDLPGSSSPH